MYHWATRSWKMCNVKAPLSIWMQPFSNLINSLVLVTSNCRCNFHIQSHEHFHRNGIGICSDRKTNRHKAITWTLVNQCHEWLGIIFLRQNCKLRIVKDPGNIVICFFGTASHYRIDIEYRLSIMEWFQKKLTTLSTNRIIDACVYGCASPHLLKQDTRAHTRSSTYCLLSRYAPLCSANALIDSPLTRYVKLRVAHAPGMLGKFFPPFSPACITASASR